VDRLTGWMLGGLPEKRVRRHWRLVGSTDDKDLAGSTGFASQGHRVACQR